MASFLIIKKISANQIKRRATLYNLKLRTKNKIFE